MFFRSGRLPEPGFSCARKNTGGRPSPKGGGRLSRAISSLRITPFATKESRVSNLFRSLPSVDAVLKATEADEALAALPRPMLRDLVNVFLDDVRERIRSGAVADAEALSLDELLPELAVFCRRESRPRFRRTLNATGVVVHTNMGRSLLCEEAAQAVHQAATRYSNLELDLSTGERGSRYSHVEELLCSLTGAEAALVVNNNAAAVLVVLDTLARGREVVVSRGQLVEIGGSFRIPEVIAATGAVLREVGATNRTHLRDYEAAIGENTAALMRVHTSNYRIVGFTSEVPLRELAELGRERGIPVIDDLGSGNFTDFSDLGFGVERTVRQAAEDGADVVTFSGDKVLGGPQAGIIIGRREIIGRIKRNPLNRALRIDKMTLAALEATLRVYTDPDLARKRIPTVAMITASPESLRGRALALAARLEAALGAQAAVSAVPGVSRVGGGAFPERDIPTTLVRVDAAVSGLTPDALRSALLDTDPPVIGRIEEDCYCLDPRTIADDEFDLLVSAFRQALGIDA